MLISWRLPSTIIYILGIQFRVHWVNNDAQLRMVQIAAESLSDLTFGKMKAYWAAQ